MDYQEAIEYMRKESHKQCVNSEEQDAYIITISAMQELQEYKQLGTLEEVREAVEKQKWIPCSERLPEESGKYEVTASDAGRLISTQVKWQPKLKSWNLTGQMAYWKIIAWKPLPEPYRPDKCHGCFGAANNDCERCMDEK